MRDDEFDALLQETIKENGEELTIHFSNKLIESMTQDEIADITEHMKSTCPDNLSQEEMKLRLFVELGRRYEQKQDDHI